MALNNETEVKALVEKWDALLTEEEVGCPSLKNAAQKANVAQLLENQERYLDENQTAAGDLGVFTPIIVPTVRRIAPALLANQIVGVQPMNGPTGYAFAWRSSYAGDGTNSLGAGVNPLHRGDSASTKQGPQFASSIITVSAATDGSTADLAPVAGNSISRSGGNAIGVIKYVEGNNLLVEWADPATQLVVTDAIEYKATWTFGSTTIVAVYGNEAQFNTILQNYSGPYSTAAGEQLNGTNMKSMRVHMERMSVEAVTRKLKAEYTLEMAQDLKAVHNMDAEAELMNVLQYEIAAETDRELVDAINNNATVLSQNWDYGNVGTQGATAGFADGQWEQEKVRTLYSKILKESNRIAITTRRGQGNFIIASPNVVAALESLSDFMYAPVNNDLAGIGSVTKAGTIGNRFTVYTDTFATSDYVTVGYKGPSNLDSGVVFCPYIPIMMQKVQHEDTFQPAIGVLTRNAIMYNMNGTDAYYRKFTCDFTGSAFA